MKAGDACAIAFANAFAYATATVPAQATGVALKIASSRPVPRSCGPARAGSPRLRGKRRATTTVNGARILPPLPWR